MQQLIFIRLKFSSFQDFAIALFTHQPLENFSGEKVEDTLYALNFSRENILYIYERYKDSIWFTLCTHYDVYTEYKVITELFSEYEMKILDENINSESKFHIFLVMLALVVLAERFLREIGK